MIEHLLGHRAEEKITFAQAFKTLLDMDLINIGEVGEQTISNASGVKRCPRNTAKIDLVSGVQIKTAQTYPENEKLQAYFAPGNTKATILLMVLERFSGKEYFFFFRHKDYKHRIGSSICLPFDSNGTPRRNNHWWDHEITFNQLCKLARNDYSQRKS
jgi:hypothetical protein